MKDSSWCETVYLDWPPNAPVPDLHCPICGRIVADYSGLPEKPVCPHLDLVFGGGEVQWVRSELEEKVHAVAERRSEILRRKRMEGECFVQEDELPDPIDAVIDAEPGEPCLLLTCHTSGIGCGPVEDTCTAVLRPMRDAYERRRW